VPEERRRVRVAVIRRAGSDALPAGRTKDAPRPVAGPEDLARGQVARSGAKRPGVGEPQVGRGKVCPEHGQAAPEAAEEGLRARAPGPVARARSRQEAGLFLETRRTAHLLVEVPTAVVFRAARACRRAEEAAQAREAPEAGLVGAEAGAGRAQGVRAAASKAAKS